VYWLHADPLGSLSEVSTGSTSLYGRQRYYPYGQVRYLWGSLPTTYNFTGQRLDGDTGLLYYGARYYDPALMRFVQVDPLPPVPGGCPPEGGRGVPQPGNPQSLNWNDDTQAW
jgi:RHS repeat-associated protein